jgi:hypothetical protein
LTPRQSRITHTREDRTMTIFIPNPTTGGVTRVETTDDERE